MGRKYDELRRKWAERDALMTCACGRRKESQRDDACRLCLAVPPAWRLKLGHGFAVESHCTDCEAPVLCGECKEKVEELLAEAPDGVLVWCGEGRPWGGSLFEGRVKA